MQQAAKQQRNQFLAAILLLFLFIILGTCLADVQMNGLTLESNFSRILNIRYDRAVADGEVQLYVLGECVNTGQIYVTELKPAVESLSQAASGYWQVAQTAVKNMNRLVEKYYTEFL